MKEPIFILWTRSFWLAFSGIIILLAQDAAAIKAFAEVASLLFGVDGPKLAERLLKLAPAVLFIAALQQRSGASRPYTIDPRARR